MNDDLFRRDFRKTPPPQPKDNLFLWTIGILLLIGFTFACWIGGFYIFGHPEKPDSYRILQKLQKLDPPKRFELTEAPPGVFLSAQKAFERYGKMTRFELEKENESLLRDYIQNYDATKRLVPYITGRYSIVDSFELKNQDFVSAGVVALAQSVDVPQVIIEHLYPADAQSVPVLNQMLARGLDIKLERTLDLSAVINVARLPDGRLQLTLMPLLYGSYQLKQGTGLFSLEPPQILNPGGGLPVVRGQVVQEGLKAYAEFFRQQTMPKRAAPGEESAIPVAKSVAETTIVRAPVPAPGASPVPAKANPGQTPEPTKVADAGQGAVPPTAETTPEPQAGKPALADSGVQGTPLPATVKPTPALASDSSRPATTEPPKVAANQPATSTGNAAPAAAGATGAGQVANANGDVKAPQQPFLVSAQTPPVTQRSGGNWRVYSPGQMPRGRLVDIGDANALAERGLGGERLYLDGNFVVTASGEDRAVLRSSNPIGNALDTVTSTAPVRVIVEFPAGMQPPKERSTVARDGTRPFEIRDVRKGTDGQVNIYVREVVTQ